MKMISLFIILCMIGCGTDAEPVDVYIDGRYDWTWYHKDFPEPVTVEIFFGVTANEGAVGTCYVSSDYKYIAIDQEYWDFASHRQRTQLIWHELGHCQLGLEHKDTLVPSVMRSYGWRDWEFFYHPDMDELTKRMLNSREDMYD